MNRINACLKTPIASLLTAAMVIAGLELGIVHFVSNWWAVRAAFGP